MIRGVRYTIETGEFAIFMTMPKTLYPVAMFINGKFKFSNHTVGNIGVFTNSRGLPMLKLYGHYCGFSDRLTIYLSERRRDLTEWVKLQVKNPTRILL